VSLHLFDYDGSTEKKMAKALMMDENSNPSTITRLSTSSRRSLENLKRQPYLYAKVALPHPSYSLLLPLVFKRAMRIQIARR